MTLQKVQRIHGIFLVILAGAMALMSSYSQMTGNGIYGFLHELPIVQLGLLQAYLLMLIIGCTLIMGSSSPVTQIRWDIIGIVAHFVPLLALALYGYLFIEMDLSYVILLSIAVHGTWIAIEFVALIFLHPRPTMALQS